MSVLDLFEMSLARLTQSLINPNHRIDDKNQGREFRYLWCFRGFKRELILLTGLCVFTLSCVDYRKDQEKVLEEARKPRPRPPFKDDPWFEKYVIEGGGVGLHPQLALSPGGLLGVAYWSTDGEEGEPCDGIEVDDPPLEVRWKLRYATWDEESGWKSEQVSRPLLLGNPPGLDLDYDRSGKPMVTSIAGEAIPELRYCGGGNLSIFTPSSDSSAEEWDVEYIVETSDQAMSGEPASDFGFVVGYWPSQSMSQSGSRMIVYQDVHGGSLQRDDLVRADLEVALTIGNGDSWTYEVIDLGEGAGIYNQSLITNEQFLALYYISFDAQQSERQRQGIWLAHRQDSGEWSRGLVFGGPTRGEPSMIPFNDGVAVVYYDSLARRPILAILEDLTQISDSEAWARIPLGDLRYNEGHSPSITRLPDGRIGVAWYRCGPAEVEECRPNDDAVIFSYPELNAGVIDEVTESANDGSAELTLESLRGAWKIEIVESGEEALCGFSPNVIVDRAQRVWVTWQCSRRVGAESSFEYRLESSRRDLFEDL